MAVLCAKGIRKRICIGKESSTLGYKKFKLVVYNKFIREIDFSLFQIITVISNMAYVRA